jgi:hypothetical protein
VRDADIFDAAIRAGAGQQGLIQAEPISAP